MTSCLITLLIHPAASLLRFHQEAGGISSRRLITSLIGSTVLCLLRTQLPIPKFNVYLRHQGKRNGFIVGFWLSVAHRTCDKYLFCFIIHAKIRVNQGVMDWGVGGSVCVRESFSKEPGFFILCIPECKPSKSFNWGQFRVLHNLFFSTESKAMISE